MDEELVNTIWDFVLENDYKVIEAIREKFDYHNNAAEWCTFCPDGFEIEDIFPREDHLCEVYAEGSYHEGRMVVCNPADGYEPFDEVYPCHFRFFVDCDESGELKLSYYLNAKKEIDIEATILED